MPRTKINLADRPSGLTFRTPQSALDRWDPTLVAMKAAAPEDGEIQILGQIGPEMWGGIDANMVAVALKAIGRAPLRVVLNSPGGDAIEGIAIYNLFAEHPAKVTMHVVGEAASAGSVIAMAGDRIEMGEASLMMIHEGMGIVMGRADDMDEMSAFLRMVNGVVAELYANRSGQKLDDVLSMMKNETWMSAKDAVEKGFADVALKKDSKKKSYASSAMSALKESIFARKSADALRAALGDTQRFAVRMSASSPGASGSHSKGKVVQTIAEQIASFEAKRAASAGRMEAIMAKAAEAGSTLDEAQTQEYDGLSSEVDAVDTHIVRLKKHESQMVAKASKITKVDDPDTASKARENSGIISVAANVEKGIPFTRYVRALAMAKGSLTGALAIAQNNKQWHEQTPQVAKVLMAAVAAGDTTTAGWASELVYNQNLVNEFIEFLRPMTIIGRIPKLTNVPFNVRVAGATAGTSAGWVGQGLPAAVSKMTTNAITLGIAKAAGIVVLDAELIRSSAPSAELLVRNDLAKAVQQFVDTQFVSPDVAAVANVSPASITSGVNPTPTTGTTGATLRTDVQTLFNIWITANLDPSGGVWIMTPTQALAISLMLNALGQPLFSGPMNTINMNGGLFFGLPVVTSQACQMIGSPVAGEGQMIVLLNAPEIMLADDGQVTIDASAEASLQMLDNPTNQSTASTAPTTVVSMFQTNSVALRATRFINWVKRRSIAVQYIKDAAYVS
jgi:HK97 family phage major capsid protein